MATGTRDMPHSEAMEIQTIRSRPDFRITTSMRWCFSDLSTADGPRQSFLDLHQRRLLASAAAFDLEAVSACLSGCEGRDALRVAIEKSKPTSLNPSRMYKLTLAISAEGTMTVAAAPLSGLLFEFRLPSTADGLSEDAQTKVYLALESTCASLFTLHKTNHRPMYATARAAANIEHDAPTTAEVLLYNEQSEVMEASLSTAYFLREGRWITPDSPCGGNLGSTRSLALENGWCTEGIISIHELQEDELMMLSNGVRGFWLARISLQGLR